MTRKPWHTGLIVVGGSLLLIAIFCVPGSNRTESKLRAADAADRGGDQAGAGPVESRNPPDVQDASTTRLSYFNATWPEILNKLADSTGSTLVMNRTPRDRTTRADRNRYSRTELVRILNRQLEPDGFRLMEQGEFLILLDLKELRTRYDRPSLDRRKNPAGRTGTRTNGRQMREQSDRREPSKSSQSGTADSGKSRYTSRPQRPDVRQMSHDEDVAAESGSTRIPARDRNPVAVVETRHLKATNVAQTIYRKFIERAELIDAGPNGLPAFCVYRRKTESQARQPRSGNLAENRPEIEFIVGIDVAQDELVVDAPVDTKRDLLTLIRAIDLPESTSAGSLHLATNMRDAGAIARGLQSGLNRLKLSAGNSSRMPALHLAQNSTDRNSTGRNQGNEEPGNSGPGPGQGAEEEDGSTETSPLSIGGLKGDVSVEALQDLGVLILRGNDTDVEEVMKVIREIEKLSEEVTPQVQLEMLRHVDSSAISVLLNNVYAQLTARVGEDLQQGPRVSFIPVVKPNAILILASKADLEPILKLVGELDQPGDPETAFEVFRLKNAVATQVVGLLTDFYTEQQGLATRVSATADVRTNSVVVQARPRDMDEISALIREIDQSVSGLVNRMTIFPLKNAVADELALVINSAIQNVLAPPAGSGQTGVRPSAPGTPQNQGNQPPGEPSQRLQDAKSVVLEFLTVDDGRQEMIRSGILSDIRITADPRTNSLVVTAPEQSMPLMSALIRQLDQPQPSVADIKVFPLVNADARTTAELLRALFAAEQQTDQFGVLLTDTADSGDSLIPLRLSVDARTNSIIAVGSTGALGVVEAILFRLDESDVRQRQTTVIRLKNSPVERVAEAINEFLSSQRDLADVDPNLVSNIELLEREIIAVPEPVTNSLLISATPRFYEEIVAMVEKLDEAPEQVIIQALLVEVQLDNTDEFGVQLGFQDATLFDRSVTTADELLTITESFSNPGTGVVTTTERIISQSATPGFLFNNQQLGNNVAGHPGRVGSQGLSDFSLGRLNGDLGFGGLVLSASSESVNVLLRALASRRTVHVLSRPQIRTLDNQPAQILVGQKVPVVNGTIPNALGVVSPAVEIRDAGIILTVTPRISPDGTIVMETRAEKSAFTGQGVTLFVDGANGNTIESPIQDIISAQTTVSVPNGQTIVLGGMITKSDDTAERKVPWLGDVPYLGKAFRYDSNVEKRTELLIFLTPRIIGNDADSELIKQVEAERLHFIEQEAEAIHGPLYAVPPEFGTHPGYREGYGDEPFYPAPIEQQPVEQTPLPQEMYPPVPGNQEIPPMEGPGGLEEPNDPEYETRRQSRAGVPPEPAAFFKRAGDPGGPALRPLPSRKSGKESVRKKQPVSSRFKPFPGSS